MDAESLTKLVPELKRFVARFADCFADRRSRDHLPVYVRGQLSDLDRKSVEPIALKAGLAPRTLQEFLSLLSWDEARMRNRVQEIVATEHAGPNSVGLIDETSFVKKGTKTPGVQRQWCGHIGKVENCVVTVHLGYSQGEFQCLLDGDLFLPESWHEDRDRCRKAGIPDDVIYRPKWQIALGQYDQARANGITFEWLTFDEGYSDKPEFLAGLSARGQNWVGEVPKNTCGWLSEPHVTSQPRRRGRRGRRPSKPRLVKGSPIARRLDVLLNRHPKLRDQGWTLYRFDDREQGPSVWKAKHVVFWPTASNGLPGEPLHAVVARHVLREGDLKFFLSNAPADTPTQTLLWVGLTRHRVERCFQDQKSELGLDHYEGRTYTLRRLPAILPANIIGVTNKVTRFLNALEQGEPRAAAQLLPLVYDELRRLAAAKMARERPDHTLGATALVHEAYLRLVGNRAYADHRHFFRVAAEAMRQILIDRARQHRRARHGGDRNRVPLGEAGPVVESQPDELLALDEALKRFPVVDPLKAELVKLRYFGGLSEQEAAETLGISRATASRYWTFARAWLTNAIDGKNE